MAVAEVSISMLEVFQDCMPAVPPDPVGVTFQLDIENTGDAPLTLDVVSATFSAEGVDVGTIGLTPTTFGPVEGGASQAVAVSKTADSLIPANGCGVLSCNGVYTLRVVLETGEGTEVSADATATVSCVF